MKRCIFILFLLTLVLALTCISSFAEGILPVLQTPLPEITSAVSLHSVTGCKEPTPTLKGNESYEYSYSKVSDQQYAAFGKALRQEGFSFSSSNYEQNGTMVTEVVKGYAKLTVSMNADDRTCKVLYSPRVEAEHYDEENPYILNEEVKSLLPEFQYVVGLHNLLPTVDRPSPEKQTSDGLFFYYYSYSKITMDQYHLYGKALAQEGFELSETESSADGAITTILSRKEDRIKIRYNPHSRYMEARYSAMIHPMENDVIFSVDKNKTSVFPELKQVISLQSVSAKEYSYVEQTKKDPIQYIYTYNDLAYDCYTLFSVKLGEAGFSMVSAEMLEDGTSRAVITDGDTTLTMDYNLETKEATVTYPASAYPASAALFDDFTKVNGGFTFASMENVTVTIQEAEFVESYYTYGYNNNWIPAKYYSTTYESVDGIQQVLIRFIVKYDRPESRKMTDLVTARNVYVDGVPIRFTCANNTNGNGLYPGSSGELSGTSEGTLAIAFALTDEQMEHLENVAVVFGDGLCLNRYVYFLGK